MKQIFIADLTTDLSFMDFFLVKEKDIRVGANQKKYLDLKLGDKTGEISAKRWDVTEAEEEEFKLFSVGDVIKIKALVTEWKGQKQLRITKIRKSAPSDGIDLNDFIKAAPEKPEDMYDYIFRTAESLEDNDLSALCIEVLSDNREKLMYYPAAQKNHHAELAGLLYHEKRMLEAGNALCGVYTNLDRSLLLAGVILHDIEKINEIDSDITGVSSGYKMEGILLGHIVQGVRDLDRRMERLGFSDEKRIMVEHMILSHHYEPEYGSPKKPMFPEAEMLHYLDMLDAKMYDMAEALTSVQEGEFSEKVWTLDGRKVYRRQEKL